MPLSFRDYTKAVKQAADVKEKANAEAAVLAAGQLKLTQLASAAAALQCSTSGAG